ncbi:MAG: sodium:calcium antiporter [Zetaproteobacteria bacterium]|nr:MAG: sodium:calcium antiporter [Zetaproteobacteria bacterium]
MSGTLFLLLAAIVLIYYAAEFFTNALEHLGERMGVSEGVTGSIFAAIGTAMPETIVPIVAILGGGDDTARNHEIGMGAILGAPFMLATVAIFLVALAAGIRRGWGDPLSPEPGGLRRDLSFFLTAYGLVLVAALIPHHWRLGALFVAIALFCLYLLYLTLTILASSALVDAGHATEAEGPLHLARYLGDHTAVAAIQLLVALLVLIAGARLFVHGVELVSAAIGIAPMVVALLLAPVATELPEKVNSMMWTARGRDTLAFGNLTGAMVFQGSVIPAIAILIMPWRIDSPYAVLAAVLAVAGALWLVLLQHLRAMTPRALLLNGLLYAAFIFFVVSS